MSVTGQQLIGHHNIVSLRTFKRLQRDNGHIVANRLEDRSSWLTLLSEGARAVASPLAHADEVVRPTPGSWHPRRHPRNVRIIPKSRDFH